ncbi:tetratricopeptide repeat protein [Larkinella humicola]|uniref:Tetratricopeptide repeat protein n=2 Tax=Larkinella humicola TaxID=2607654 RepID=A0A5N1JIN8_9BACT|nr:tetratricopeptide repeat protein [Larkinella humicola]
MLKMNRKAVVILLWLFISVFECIPAAQAQKNDAKKYKDLMDLGVAAFQKKDFTAAIRYMSEAGNLMPTDTIAPLYTGIAAQQLKDEPAARNQFEKYVVRGGRDAAVFYALSSIYKADQDYEKALSTLDKAIAIHPANRDLANERINIFLTANRIDEAIDDLKKAVVRNPNDVQSLVNLSIIYSNIAAKTDEEVGKLEIETKRESDLGKQLADTKKTLDVYLTEQKRLNALLRKQPQNAELKRQLGMVKQRITDNQATIVQLEANDQSAMHASAALESGRRLAEVREKYVGEKKLEKAYLTRALALDPGNYDANFNMGVWYFNQAVKLKKVVDGMNSAEYAQYGRRIEGQVCGTFKKVVPYFERARETKSTEADLNEHLTNLQNILKQFEEKKVACVMPIGDEPFLTAIPADPVTQRPPESKPTTTPGPKPGQTTPTTTAAARQPVDSKPDKPTEPPTSQAVVVAFPRRFALVVGNSAYQNGSSLEGMPVNDATDIADRLRALGFLVTLVTNSTKSTLETSIGQFNQQLKNADVALFFYAGHGIEFDNHNYLIPVDAKLTDPDDVDLQGVDVQKLIDRMRRNTHAAFNVIIMDACRDNPFKSFSRGGSRGFKPVGDLSGEGNMYLAMATGWGNVAENSSGRNGVYTRSLLNHLRSGEVLDDVLLRTQIEVKRQTQNRQNPQVVTEMAQEIKLKF